MRGKARRGPETLGGTRGIAPIALRHQRPRMHQFARLAGIGLYGGTMLEGGIGTAATAHVCATFPELAWGTELFGPLLLTEEVLRTPLVYRDFMLEVPTGPGLGVDIDIEKLQALRRR